MSRPDRKSSEPMQPSGDSPVALVTGASNGIGRAVAAHLVGSGFDVYGLDLAPAADPALEANFVSGDVRSSTVMDRVAERMLATRGRIDVLCCCAGIKTYGGPLATSEADWRHTIDVNLTGTFLAVAAALPTMQAQRRGSIITIGSPSGYAEKGALAYAASKGAILSFTRSLALDCLADHVQVNAIVPGVTRSGMTEGLSAGQLLERGTANVTGRVNEPSDVAQVVGFLVSPQAATISGAIIEVGKIQGAMAEVGRRGPDANRIARQARERTPG